MTGSLQIKNGKYYAVLNTHIDGKRKQKWICSELPVKGNKTRAEKFLREQIAAYEQQEQLVSCDMSFGDYVRRWLKSTEGKVDIITYQGYEKLVEIHVAPYFDEKGLQVQQITPDVLQRYFDEKAAHGRKDGNGGLSPCSLRKHRNILHQALKQAVKERLLLNNPCDYVKLPKSKRFEPNFCDKDEIEVLLAAVREERIFPFVLIAAVYGLRRSEICGLQWNSVNFETNTLTIRHTVVKAQTLVKKDTTKSASSYRSFPLLPPIRELLLNIRRQQQENRRLFGRAYIDSPYIFTWDEGRLMTPDYVSHAFSKCLDKHGLPHIRFHDLRHSCASILLSCGYTLKDVQEWLGHADITLTANTYGHLDMTRKRELADTMNNMLLG